MARVNVDTKALADHRIRLLGKRLGCDRFGALGRLVAVWHACTESGAHVLRADDIDAAADTEGMAVAMVDVGLAREEGSGIYVCGTTGRIEWLEKYGGRNHNGGVKRAEGARRVAGRFAPNSAESTSVTSLPPAYAGESPPAYTSALCSLLSAPCSEDQNKCRVAPDDEGGAGSEVEPPPERPVPPQLELVPPPPPPKGAAEVAREETASFLDWFNRIFGRSFQGSLLVEKQVRAILAQGFDQDDMRAVAWFLKGKWEGKPEMVEYLVPQTVLRPTAFSARLDEARQLYPKERAQ